MIHSQREYLRLVLTQLLKRVSTLNLPLEKLLLLHLVSNYKKSDKYLHLVKAVNLLYQARRKVYLLSLLIQVGVLFINN